MEGLAAIWRSPTGRVGMVIVVVLSVAALLSLVNVDSGEFLGRDGQAVAVVHRDEGNGLVTINVSRPPAVRGVDGQGSVCILTFKANAPGDTTVSLTKVGAKDSAQASLPAVGSQATVHLQ